MNQSAVQAFGLEEPIGKKIVYKGDHYKVVGIMENFSFDSPVYPPVYFMQDWLTQFAYRIEIGTGLFVFTALLSLSLVVVAIGRQALKAALMNPVDSIRNE